MNRKCSFCKRELELTKNFYKNRAEFGGYEYGCKECRFERSRQQDHRSKWNKEHREQANKSVREYYARNPEKVKAWKMFKRAVKTGNVLKQPCLLCGDNAQGHHKDYSKPLEVVWLCRRHHKDVHYGRIIV